MHDLEAGKMTSNTGRIVDWIDAYPPERPLYRAATVSPVPPSEAEALAVTVIHGPMATGKTFHAARFAEHYGCGMVIDDLSIPRSFAPPPGSLVLTTRHSTLRTRWPDARFIHIDDARRAIGLAAAPAGGFRP